MAVTDLDLDTRSRQFHRAHIAIASVVTAIGALLLLSIVLSSLGLIVFSLGMIWLVVAILLGRADRNRRETQRSPGEAKAG